MEQLDKWHKTRVGLAVFGLVELAAAYVFASWSIDSGSMWDYFFTLLFIFGSLQNFVKLTRSYIHGKHQSR